MAEELLASNPDVAPTADAVCHLLCEELCLRQEHGVPIVRREILSRFPQLQEQVGILLSFHALLDDESGRDSYPHAGDTILGFQLLTELGRGARSRVFLASQQTLSDRPVVVKVVPPESVEHFRLARLQQTHIVPLYSAHLTSEREWLLLCMPYFGSRTLADILEGLKDVPLADRSGQNVVTLLDRETSGLPVLPRHGSARRFLSRISYVSAICWIGSCLAEALQYAHEHDLVHLDIKPSNVLLTSEGQPMLLDFHLAQPPFIPGNDPPAWLGGTGPYMSPEQRDALDAVRAGMPIRRPVDARSDIHSLGVLLCECLGFDLGREPGAITPSRLPISRGLADILARCLDPQAERRYARAADFAEDLRRHMNDLPLRGVPNRSWTERWSKWRRRSPHDLARYGLAVILLGLAFAGAVVVALENVPRETSLPGESSPRSAESDDSRGARTSPAPGEANDGTSEKGVSLEAAEQHRLGRRLLEEGNYQQAQGPLARAVALEPNRLWFRFHQGVCHYRLGELEDAIAAFTASIALSTGRDRAICHLNRGLAHTQAGRDLRALRDYDTALDLDPTLGAAAMNRGVLHYRRGAWSLAFADLHRALRHGADVEDTLFNLALVHQARGEKRAALDCLTLILERTPSHAEAGNLRHQLESR